MMNSTAAVLAERTQSSRVDLVRAFAGITMTPWPAIICGGAIERRFQIASDVVIAGRFDGATGWAACVSVRRQTFPFKSSNNTEQMGKRLVLPDTRGLVFCHLQPRVQWFEKSRRPSVAPSIVTTLGGLMNA